MKPPLVLFVGEPMIELSVPEDRDTARLGVAGDVLNAAIYMRRALPPPARIELVTALGQDRFSDRIEAFMRAHGVGCDRVRRDPERGPGLYAIETDAAGERSLPIGATPRPRGGCSAPMTRPTSRRSTGRAMSSCRRSPWRS